MRCLAILAVLCLDCVAPGSSIGTLSVRGRLVGEGGQPLANRELQLILPAEYGLGGLDLVLNKPEDFGYTDQRLTTTSDTEGRFRIDLGETTYHISFWLIPPLGGFPRRPPAPFILLRLTPLTEYYAVETWSGRYKAFHLEGAELPASETALSRVEARSENDPATEGGTVAIVELSFRHQ